MDVIARLPGCTGQAADAVSAYTQGKMEDASALLKLPKSESNIEDLVLVLLERNLYGRPLAGFLWERQFEKVLLGQGWEKVPNWEGLLVYRKPGLFLSVDVDDIKNDWKKAKLSVLCGRN